MAPRAMAFNRLPGELLAAVVSYLGTPLASPHLLRLLVAEPTLFRSPAATAASLATGARVRLARAAAAKCRANSCGTEVRVRLVDTVTTATPYGRVVAAARAVRRATSFLVPAHTACTRVAEVLAVVEHALRSKADTTPRDTKDPWTRVWLELGAVAHYRPRLVAWERYRPLLIPEPAGVRPLCAGSLLRARPVLCTSVESDIFRLEPTSFGTVRSHHLLLLDYNIDRRGFPVADMPPADGAVAEVLDAEQELESY